MKKAARVCPVCGNESDEKRCPLDDAATVVADWVRSILRARQPGDTIDGRYAIVAEIHTGTSSRVYAARHNKTERPVALKMLASNPLKGDDPVVARFAREAKLIAGLTSRHVVHVLDYGTDEGAPYMALELVRGLGLDVLLKEAGEQGRPLGAEIAAEIAAGVLRGLGDAHAAGLVHRNLKPAHVLFSRAGLDELDIKVGGFGKVRPETSDMTRSGEILSSPAYMSPEAIMNQPLDGRSDLYALGVVLFRVLGNKLPYTAANRMVVMALHVNEPVPDPVVDPVSPIGAGMAAFVQRLLAKKAEDRFGDATDALKHLMRLADSALVDTPRLKALV